MATMINQGTWYTEHIVGYNKWVTENNIKYPSFQMYLDFKEQESLNRLDSTITVKLSSAIQQELVKVDALSFSNLSEEQVYCGSHNTVSMGKCPKC